VASPTAEIKDPFGLVGTLLDGQYRIDAVVGEGGFGVVYRGFHLSLEQPIAIKALKVITADEREVQDALFAKFKDEAKLLYTLSQSSLNIVRSIDFGAVIAPSGHWTPFMILEWLEGRSLAEDLARRRRAGMRGRSLDEALAIFQPALAGLTVAHQRRVAHRDVKPANVFLLPSDDGLRVKVLDFGIAKIIRDGDGPGTRSPFSSFTWLYAAPEQLDPRVGQTGLETDVYSLALVLTELLTDRSPGEGRDPVALLKAATDPTHRPTPRQRGANVPDDVEAVCRRALAVDPKARFPSAGEFAAALSASLRPSSPRPVGSPSTLVAAPIAPAARIPTPPVSPPYSMPGGPGRGPPPGGPMTSARAAQAGAMTAMVPSRPLHPMDAETAAALSPPRMTPPPGAAPYPPRRQVPPSSSSLPVVLAVIGLVLGLLFVATCSAIHAACG